MRKVVVYELLSLDAHLAAAIETQDAVVLGRRSYDEWAKTSTVDGDLARFVRDLKDQDGADIGVRASISVAQALPAAGYLLADYSVSLSGPATV